MAERSPGKAEGAQDLITHSNRFVLVDVQGQIRGYYRGTDPEEITRLLRDLAALQRRA